MLTRIQLSIIAGLTIAMSFLWLMVRGEEPSIGGVTAILGTVITLIYTAVMAFGKYAWPWAVFRGWLVKRPDLRGSWKVTLVSDYIDPNTGIAVPPIRAYMVVRQTLTTLSMRLFTKESRSVSVAHSIEQETDGLFGLSAVYRNVPKIEHQGKKSAIHHGALLMEIHEVIPQRLEGHYWTDRRTRGEIVMERKSGSCFSSFEDASRALDSL
ncbi:MAG TPA: hypothetical protein VK629_09280 [Steroidobacteraceae bacterium]|nr:hypothetical protein [Steroidobacteraceae bacterium]